MVAVNYTNYSPLIAIIRTELHANSAQVGLFSTLLFLGLATAYIPAGILGDRLGARPVLIGSCALMGISAMLLKRSVARQASIASGRPAYPVA